MCGRGRQGSRRLCGPRSSRQSRGGSRAIASSPEPLEEMDDDLRFGAGAQLG